MMSELSYPNLMVIVIEDSITVLSYPSKKCSIWICSQTQRFRVHYFASCLMAFACF